MEVLTMILTSFRTSLLFTTDNSCIDAIVMMQCYSEDNSMGLLGTSENLHCQDYMGQGLLSGALLSNSKTNILLPDLSQAQLG